MSRPPRQISSTGLYHIIFRGINRQNIFEEENDFIKFKEMLIKVKEDMHFETYAYCLMNNHVHMFIKEKVSGDISKIMIKLLTNYAGWFNRKYLRSGSLIGNRYKSEPIEDERYFFTLTRYIHQNPMKAGLVSELEGYKWSSYYEYLNGNEIIDTEFVLKMFSDKPEKALKVFIELHRNEENEDFHISNGKRLTDEQIKRKIIKALKGNDVNNIAVMSKDERNAFLCYLREKERFSIAQIERVTGISRRIVARCNSRNVMKKARPQ